MVFLMNEHKDSIDVMGSSQHFTLIDYGFLSRNRNKPHLIEPFQLNLFLAFYDQHQLCVFNCLFLYSHISAVHLSLIGIVWLVVGAMINKLI